MDRVTYQELFGSLLYMEYTKGPDMSFVVGLLTRYLKNPGQAHWSADCNLMQYLSGTLILGIKFCSSTEKNSSLV